MAGRDAVQDVQQGQGVRPLRVLPGRRLPGAAGGGRRVAVLARQEPLRQTEVGHAGKVLLDAHGEQRTLETLAFDQVVRRLHRYVACGTSLVGDGECLRQPFRGGVRRGNVTHLPGRDQGVQRRHGLFQGRVRIVGVRVVEVDPVGPEAAQRVLHRLTDHLPSESGKALPAAHLGGDDHLVPDLTGGEPAADDRLGLAAAVAGSPLGVGVGGVDEIAAGLHVGVEDVERGVLVDGPAEDAATQAEREDIHVGLSNSGHGCSLVAVLGSC